MLSQSLKLPSFLFILFSLSCSTAVISTILSSSSFIHSSALVTLLYSFQLIFHFSYCGVHHYLSVLQFSQVLVNYFLYPLNPCLHAISEILIISAIFTLNSFPGRLPVSFLFELLNFYLVPLPATYFSVISFCPIYCVFGLLSADSKIIVPFAVGLCPLVDEVGTKIMQASSWCLCSDRWSCSVPQNN